MWRRIKLDFVPSLKVEFTNRDRALRQIEELAERGTGFPIVIYGPEGCGKTALFRQTLEILRDHGYSVVYTSPLEEREDEKLVTTEDISDIVTEIVQSLTSVPVAELVEIAVRIVYRALRHGKRRVAIIADDIFQAVGLDRAEAAVKKFLNLIEYPSSEYEKVVVLVGSSEGITTARVGRHSWAWVLSMWNMSKEGFRKLYEQIPGDKPPFEEVWRWTGGNPRLLRELYLARWSPDVVISRIIRERRLLDFVARLTSTQRRILEEALEDPDVLLMTLSRVDSVEKKGEVGKLVDMLVELNLIMYCLGDRREDLWIDVPPPDRDLELGIGRHVAWQSPVYREAVRKALSEIT